MPVLHLGARDAAALALFIEREDPARRVVRDGDSWDEWGEPHVAGTPEHLVVFSAESEAPDFLALLADVVFCAESDPDLQIAPMEHEYQRGCIAVVSNADDWSEVSYSVYAGSGVRASGARGVVAPA